MVDNFSNVFKVFNYIVTTCYGSELAANYVKELNKFSPAYLDLGINVTPKVHAAMHHVQEFSTLTGRGLDPWSEQASKTTHHDFK